MATLLDYVVSTRGALFSSGGVAAAVSLATAASVGDFIVAVTFLNNDVRSISGITGDGVTYAQLRALQSGDAGRLFAWGGYVTGAGGGQNVVETLSAANGDDAIIALLRIGSPAIAQTGMTTSASLTAAGTAHNSGAATPASASNVTIGFQWRTNGTWTEDGAFTRITTPDGGGDNSFLGYIENAPASTQQLDTVSDGAEYSVSMILCIDGLIATATRSQMMMLGVG